MAWGEEGREWDRWAFWVFGGCKLLNLERMDWDPTVQDRKMCVIGSICCTTEIGETLSINYTCNNNNHNNNSCGCGINTNSTPDLGISIWQWVAINKKL